MPSPENTRCPRCGHLGLILAERLRARPPESHSLSGSQLKVSAIRYLAWECAADDCDAYGPAEATAPES